MKTASLKSEKRQLHKIIYRLGSVASLDLKDAPGDMLSPPEHHPNRHWGKIYQLGFFPAPWVLDWFTIISLKENDYDLIWSHNGNIRSTITLRSKPITLSYKANPYFKPDKVTIECYLYRIINSYPEAPYYMEDLLVLTKEGLSLSFKPYFESEVYYTDFCNEKIARFESIPDYFALWSRHGIHSRGYGFASDGHVRGFDISKSHSGSSIIRWRLQNMHHNRCIHYFMFHVHYSLSHGYADDNFDIYHKIGHNGWYEKVFKPLEAIPYGMQYEEFAVAKRYIPLPNKQ